MQEFISTLADAFGSYGDRNSAPCDGEIDTSLDYGVDNKNTSLNAVGYSCTEVPLFRQLGNRHSGCRKPV